MKYENLKHKFNGQYKLQWNWVEKNISKEELEDYAIKARARGLRGKDLEMPPVWHFNYRLTFDSKEDALEHYRCLVKDFWPEDVKWEIVDIKVSTFST